MRDLSRGGEVGRLYRAPSICPVCSDELITLRVGCPSCGTELSGHFYQCRFCQLDGAERAILEVFLRSRGNVREVQSHLGVSYPTARQRVAELLGQLGFADQVADRTDVTASTDAALHPPAASPSTRAASPSRPEPDPGDVLAEVAAGRMTVSQAEDLLSEIYGEVSEE